MASSKLATTSPNPSPRRIGQREMLALNSFSDQIIELVRVRGIISLKDNQFPSARNDCGLALECLVRQLSQSAFCLAYTARIHAVQN
jgi:hypothetical protein